MSLLFAKTDKEFQILKKELFAPAAGGFVTFIGKVRSSNFRKKVDHLFYEADEELANNMFLQLLNEAINRFSIIKSVCVHRIGRVDVGMDAVVISVCSKHRHQAFMAARFLIDGLKANLPIWKKEIYDDQSFSFGNNGCHCDQPNKLQQKFFNPVARALDALKIPINSLGAKKVLLIGAGGLGCPVAINLSSLGIGRIDICDGDVVEDTNLARQFVYRISDVGQNKALLLMQFLQERNPICKVLAIKEFINRAIIEQMIKDYDLVIDASDCRQTKAMLKEKAYAAKKPLISASVHSLDGDVQSFVPSPDKACLGCFVNDQTILNGERCQDTGVLTHICFMVASVVSSQALMILCGKAESSCQMTLVDPRHNGLLSINIGKDPLCGICGFGNKNASKKRIRLVRLERKCLDQGTNQVY